MDNEFQELFEDFVLEARERLDAVEELLLALPGQAAAQRPEAMAQARRELHTLKGNSGMMGLSELQQLAHGMEDQVDELDLERPQVVGLLEGVDTFRRLLRRLVQGESETAEAGTDQDLLGEASQELALGGVRVPFSELDALVELQAEVLLYRNRLADGMERLRRRLAPEARESHDAWDETEAVRQSLEKTLDFAQDRILKLRMVPLQSLFRHLNRIVHDEAAREGKQVRFDTEGGETPLDKSLLELASEALGHLVRNAVNHGVEEPGARRQAGKSVVGRIRLSASVQGQEVLIEVADDGAGIDTDQLQQEAERRGATADLERGPYGLIFQAGFSTRGGTDLSAGRGIGLAAVAGAVERHGGRVEVASEVGEGTRFLLRLPLSVSITRALLVWVGEEEFALPLGAVIESLRFTAEDLHALHHGEVLRWRGQVVPLVDLGRRFGLPAAVADGTALGQRFVVLVEAFGQHRGLLVDGLGGIRDIVVKGLDRLVGAPAGVAGSTILGDGRVVMILDPAVLAAPEAVSAP
ncbi:MAG: chemotaxis protein CheW [Acidobacteria bacterium]|nr:chemotaxis protein CheW [Acidobacteriota bacterium]